MTKDNLVIDIYTKTGNIGLYNSILFLIPDYDIGATVLTARYARSANDLGLLLVQNLLPAIDEIAKEQASKRFTGTYTDPVTNSSAGSPTAPLTVVYIPQASSPTRRRIPPMRRRLPSRKLLSALCCRFLATKNRARSVRCAVRGGRSAGLRTAAMGSMNSCFGKTRRVMW